MVQEKYRGDLYVAIIRNGMTYDLFKISKDTFDDGCEKLREYTDSDFDEAFFYGEINLKGITKLTSAVEEARRGARGGARRSKIVDLDGFLD